MKKLIICFACLLIAFSSFAQKDSIKTEMPIVLETTTGKIYGSLVLPLNPQKQIPLVLIIAGSGPTDRDCNQPTLKTDAFKLLAKELAAHQIASVRYDKRGIGASKESFTGEANLRFDNYINDAANWVNLLKGDKRFSSVTIIGHSEGSLIGMLAAEKANQFISIAGAGQSADKLIKQQLQSQPQAIKDAAIPILDSLSKGLIATSVNPLLFSLFRPSVQPYMISWFKYDPQVEIGKLKIPTFIIQGDNDLQVGMDEAELLSKANTKAKKVIIPGMTHTLKIAASHDRQANLKTYTDPTIPISTELVDKIVSFVFNK